MNFGLARDFGGVCHLRFDDTNPEKEDQEYVDAIIEAVHWLGFDWKADGNDNLYFASDYFGYMYEFAEALIEAGHAYVDAQSADEIRANRGTLTEPGVNSPWRDRPAAESLALLREMRDGKHPDGSLVLRAKINMASPNINLRDPVMYRVRHAHHHRTGDKWCIYPMYSWAHPVEDALEGITHSVCTLEFEDQRPFYDWILARLAELGKLAQPLPRQYEFARLNLSYIVTSKRKLPQLVREGHVDGWDDPRMPTIRPAPPRLHRVVDPPVLRPHRRVQVRLAHRLQPAGAGRARRPGSGGRALGGGAGPAQAGHHQLPRGPERNLHGAAQSARPRGRPARIPADARTLIERDDFREEAPKKYFRLFPGNTVRLKYGYVVRCTGFTKNEAGEVVEVQAEYLPDTKSGTPAPTASRSRATSPGQRRACRARADPSGDRLFADPRPDGGDKDFLTCLNPNSKQTVTAWLEPGTVATPGATWQFERLGYFTADLKESTAENPVLNRVVTLRDSRRKADSGCWPKGASGRPFASSKARPGRRGKRPPAAKAENTPISLSQTGRNRPRRVIMPDIRAPANGPFSAARPPSHTKMNTESLALDFKSAIPYAIRVVLHSADPERLSAALAKRMADAGSFFENEPGGRCQPRRGSHRLAGADRRAARTQPAAHRRGGRRRQPESPARRA